MEKAQEFQKNIYFCFIDYAKAFDCVDHKKLWKILKARLQQTWTKNFQMYKLDLEKAEEPEIKLPKSTGS